jgi:hypothetical protein
MSSAFEFEDSDDSSEKERERFSREFSAGRCGASGFPA